MIVYCANIGRKDAMREPLVKHDGVEYVYFVDNKEGYESSIWDIREVPLKYDNRLTSKWYKMHPHLLFPGEDTIWIDGTFMPHKGSPLDRVSTSMVLRKHIDRDCLYDEAAICLNRAKGNPSVVPEDIIRQVAVYRSEGMPEHYGLYQSGIMCRKPEARLFNEAWWKQVTTFSVRDQISLPYVLWKESIPFSVFSKELTPKSFMKAGRHLR